MDVRTVALRLGLAFLLGSLLGLERELRGQSAGLRTHLLVSLGSCRSGSPGGQRSVPAIMKDSSCNGMSAPTPYVVTS